MLIVSRQSVTTTQTLESKGGKQRLACALLAIYVVTFLLFILSYDLFFSALDIISLSPYSFQNCPFL